MGVSVSAKRLKDNCVYPMMGNQDSALRLHYILFLWTVPPLSHIPSLPWLATAWTCRLELREGHGGWMKPISCNQEMVDTERLLCPGAPQGPARYQQIHENWVYSFVYRATVTKNHSWAAETTEVDCLTTLEARISRSSQLVPSEAVRESLIQASLWVPGGLLAIFGVPGLVESSPRSLPSSSPGVFPVCMSVCPHFSLILVILCWGPP